MLFEDFTAPIFASFLLKWPDLSSLQKIPVTRLRAFFYAQGSRRSKRIEERLDQIVNAQALTTDAALIDPSALMAQTLARVLQALHKGIAPIEEQIQESMDEHPDAPLFRSFPGAGPVMAPRLLAAFGTDRNRFQSALELQQYYGIAPVRKQSGRSQLVHMRYRCPKFGRQSFHENAAQALKETGWAKNYYHQQRGNKKGHHASVRSVAFKLMRIYFACWQSNTCYDAAQYEKSLRARGSTLLKMVENSTAKNCE